MTNATGKHRMHQFVRLDTDSRPFPPRLLIEDAAQDIEDYILETAPPLAQEWCETMADGEQWKESVDGELGDYMLNVYFAQLDTDAALHNAQLYLWKQCIIDDPQ